MSLNLGAMSAAVTLDVSQYKRNLSTLENESGKTFSRVAKAAAGFFTARALFGFVNSSMLEFSKFEEGNNKLKYTFTEVREEAERTAKQIAEIYNLAPQTATNAISDIGDMLTGFGFAQAQALDFAKQITERGIDIASFKGLDQTETIRRMTAALTGETDSLKMMGVVIRQDTSEFRDNIKTIQETTGATEAQAKAQAILAQIIEQTKNAEGDYLRPDAPRTYAQELTDLREAVKKFKLEIGTQLQPIAQDSVVKARELLNWYNELNPASKELLGTTTALAASLGVLSKSGILSSANKAFNVVAGGFSSIQAKAEADMIASTENLKRAEYAKTEAFRKAHAAAQSVRVAKSVMEERTAAITTAKIQLQQAQNSGNTAQIIAAKKQLTIATESLTQAQVAESVATQKLAASHAAARVANLQHAAAEHENKIAINSNAAAATLGGKAHIILASGMTKAKLAATALMTSLGPVGIAIIALGAAYSTVTYFQNKYNDYLNGQAKLAEEATKKIENLTDEHSKNRLESISNLSRLEKLSQYERLNNSERTEAEQLITNLTQKYGDLGIAIDSTTGKLLISKDAWKKFNDQQAKQFTDDSLEKQKALIDNMWKQYNVLLKKFGGNWYSFGNISNLWGAEGHIAEMMGSDRNDPSSIAYHYIWTGLQKKLLTIKRESATLTKQISAYEDLRQRLVGTGGYDDEVQQLDKFLEILYKIRDERKKLAEFNKKGKYPDQTNTAEEAKAQSEMQRKLQVSIQDLEWDIKFNASDVETRAKMLSYKIQQIFEKQSGKYNSIEAFKYADRNTMTEQELKDLQEIIKLEEQRRLIRKESADAFSAEHESYAYYLENLEKQRREKAVDKEIEAARQAGDLISVDAIMQREFVKARDAANAMKREYERALHDAEADNIFTEEEKKRISELRRNLEEANATAEKYAIDKISSSEDQMQEARANSEAVGAFNSKILASLFGQTAPAEETAKNTRKTVEYLRELLISQENSTTMRYT